MEICGCQLTVAIDGLAGAGKSYIAEELAKIFNRYFCCVHVDTGALYRAVGVFALRSGINPDDKNAVIAALPNFSIDVCYDLNGVQNVIMCGEHIADSELRSDAVSTPASKMSSIPEVRAVLLKQQRSLASRYSVIMDGRDIGTVVLPEADVKIYVQTSVDIRAHRRYAQYVEAAKASGNDISTINIEQIKSNIIERDYRDTHRAIAPCIPADDSDILDNSDKSPEETVRAAYDIIMRHCGDKLALYAVRFSSSVSEV